MAVNLTEEVHRKVVFNCAQAHAAKFFSGLLKRTVAHVFKCYCYCTKNILIGHCQQVIDERAVVNPLPIILERKRTK